MSNKPQTDDSQALDAWADSVVALEADVAAKVARAGADRITQTPTKKPDAIKKAG